jgi:type IV secretory pathway VirB4 component
LFQISLENSFKNDVYLGYHNRLQPSEIERMPYYKYEYYVQHLSTLLQEKKEAEEGQSKSYQQDQPSINKTMADARRMMPSMGSMPKFPGMPSGFKI